MNKNVMFKRGVSPIVATVLLISIVLVLSGIVFLWARGFVAEGIQKFGGPVERACDDVDFEAGAFHSDDGTGYVVEINNQADVPLYGFEIKALGEGEVRVSDEVQQSIGLGQSGEIYLSASDFTDTNEILVVPVLLGSIGSAPERYVCPDSVGVGVTLPGV